MVPHHEQPPRRDDDVEGEAGRLVLLATGAGAWAYVRSQWYVGDDGEQVSVDRGVSGKVAGVAFSSVQEHTGLTTDRLSELDREKVQDGIGAEDRADAVRIVRTLTARALPEGCAVDAPCPAPSTSGALPAPTDQPSEPVVTPLPSQAAVR